MDTVEAGYQGQQDCKNEADDERGAQVRDEVFRFVTNSSEAR